MKTLNIVLALLAIMVCGPVFGMHSDKPVQIVEVQPCSVCKKDFKVNEPISFVQSKPLHAECKQAKLEEIRAIAQPVGYMNAFNCEAFVSVTGWALLSVALIYGIGR